MKKTLFAILIILVATFCFACATNADGNTNKIINANTNDSNNTNTNTNIKTNTNISVNTNTNINANTNDSNNTNTNINLNTNIDNNINTNISTSELLPTDSYKLAISNNNNVVFATFENNSSSVALIELLKNAPITIDMHDYGNFEKVGPLGHNIITNDTQITTTPGDVILYQGNQITIYYDVNSWNFTKLAHVDGATKESMKTFLGNGNPKITLSLIDSNKVNSQESIETTNIQINNEVANTQTKNETNGGNNMNNKILVAYFSATGTTKNVAENINAVVDGDLYEIVPMEPYSSDDLNWNDSKSRTSIEMNDPKIKPAINGTVANIDDYKIIFLGYPIWWGDAPHIIDTFMETYKFDGKTIIPFCTSGGSGIGQSAKNLYKYTSENTKWINGKKLSANASKESLKKWIDDLSLGIGTK